MQVPDVSNLNTTAAAVSISVAFNIDGNPQTPVSVTIANALLAIAGYLDNPVSPTVLPVYFGAKASAADAATQKFNELVAAINRLAA